MKRWSARRRRKSAVRIFLTRELRSPRRRKLLGNPCVRNYHIYEKDILQMARNQQNSEVPKVLQFVIVGTTWTALLALVVFIAWATLNPLIIAVAILSAAYLAFVATYLAILKDERARKDV